MKRILILGIALTAFAFSLFLMNCGGPTANNSNGGANTPANSQAPVKLNAACDSHDRDTIEDAIRTAVMGEPYLKNHYSHDHPETASMDFHLHKDGDGFKLKVEGNMARFALSKLLNIMDSFAGDGCVRRVIFVTKTNSKVENENANADSSKLFGRSFEWDLTCQDPSHPCSDGSCVGSGASCPAYKDNSNTNTNTTGNANASPSPNRGNNTSQ